MLETGIPVSVWLQEPEDVIILALHRVEEIRRERARNDR